MFYFKSKDDLVVTCSNAGYWNPDDNKHYERKLLLEPMFDIKNRGVVFIVRGKDVPPERWVETIKVRYGWDVIPIALIEVEWE